METLAVSETRGLVISEQQAELIRSSVSENTLKAYRHATQKLETWLDGRVLDDGLLAEYITELHSQGKSPATIALVVAAVKWQAKDLLVGGSKDGGLH
jgi:site-specific recombinase XerD